MNPDEKICLNCSKILLKKDYASYKGYSNHFWQRRKFCSKSCMEEYHKKQRKLAKIDFSLEHNHKIILANEVIKGKIVGINSQVHYKGSSTPDITKDGKIYEMEILGNTAFRKFKNKHKEFKGEKVLIISIREDLKKLFDKVYILEEIDLLKSAKNLLADEDKNLLENNAKNF